MEFLLKGLMGAGIGATFFSLLFMAPGGAVLTRGASMEPVQRQAQQGTRGPRYVFVGGYYGGK